MMRTRSVMQLSSVALLPLGGNENRSEGGKEDEKTDGVGVKI